MVRSLTRQLKRILKKIFLFWDDDTRDPHNPIEFAIGSWFLFFSRLAPIFLFVQLTIYGYSLLLNPSSIPEDWLRQIFLVGVVLPGLVSLAPPLAITPMVYWWSKRKPTANRTDVMLEQEKVRDVEER